MLAASGIAPTVIAARGYWTATNVEQLRSLGFADYQCRTPALAVPLWNVAGRQVGCQIRPDNPRLNDQGKPIKYESPRGSRPAVDVPPSVLADLRDVRCPLFITEGSKKADAAASRGRCCVSLAGVYGWRGRGADGASRTLPDWDDVPLDGREVGLAFDSDVTRKPAVRDALVRLAAMLARKGARVKIIILPDVPGLAKTGLDDFLVAREADDLERLIRETPIWDPDGESSPLDPVGPHASPPEEPAPPLPIDVLPHPIRRFVDDGATALDVPPELIAVPFLAFTAGLIGRHLRIVLKRGYTQYPAIWVAIVGGPGTGKSPALDFARQPFDRLQAEAFAAYKAEVQRWEEQTAGRSGKGDGPPPARPREQTYYASDATLESLPPLLEVSPGLTLSRDELVGWVRSYDQYRNGGDRQSWLSLWSGAPLKVNRRTAATIFVEHPVVAVVGGVQPDLLPELAAEGNKADGFLDRFLWAFPPAHFPGWTDADVDPQVIEDVTALCRLLRPNPAPEPALVPLTGEARSLFRDWYQDNQAQIQAATGLAAGAYAKLPNQLARLALILHALHRPEDPVRPVDARTMRDAIRLVEWFRAHLGRVLPLLGAATGLPRGAGVVARVQRILERAAGARVSRSELGAALGGHIPGPQIGAALDRLATDGRAETRTLRTGKRPREQWRWLGAGIRDLRDCELPAAHKPVIPVLPRPATEPAVPERASRDEYEEIWL